MRLETFISRRIVGNTKKTVLTKSFSKIAITSLSLGLCIMIVSTAVVKGFKEEIRNKVIGFTGHIQISTYDNNNAFESKPIFKNDTLENDLKSIKGVTHFQSYSVKTGIIKNNTLLSGIVLKGVDKKYDWTFVNSLLLEGKSLNLQDTIKSDEIIISKKLSLTLNYKLGDALHVYFVQNPPRARKFKIVGIYESGMDELDKTYAICDMRHINKLNNWQDNQASAYEVFIDDYDNLKELGEKIYNNIDYRYNAKTVRELYPQIFSWLDILDTNVLIIMILMLAVTIITIITTLLILILEQTNLIGTLKALGAGNWLIKKIFLIQGIYIATKALIIGNIIAITICFIQYHYKIISLPQESYYMNKIPISINVIDILLINALILVICFFTMLIPSYIISKIKPAKAIKFS